MKLENQVCSLESAKRLEELGVKQESLWYWVYIAYDLYEIVFYRQAETRYKDYKKYSAFTIAELGEMLPNKIRIARFDRVKDKAIEEDAWLHIDKEGISYTYTFYNRDDARCEVDYIYFADTEANARAKMVIYLRQKW